MKKICVVTAARSEYGLLKWIMKDIEAADNLQLQVVVTGGHLMQSQGHTVDVIINDGFAIDKCVDVAIDTSSEAAIAQSNGRMAAEFAKAFEELAPDYVLVLGDRYELLAICSSAFVMRIPIIHLSGGDVTEGAIDDGIRNAITMLASYHFPATTDAASNIVRMRGSDINIWTVGEPGLDSANRLTMMSRKELADNLGLDTDKKWILLTYHSETRLEIKQNLEIIKSILAGLIRLTDYQIVATYANSDFGGMEINEILEKEGREHADRIVVVPSLGQKRYLSFMKQVAFVIGNSSSGIIEAPFFGARVINIGNRQKGRYQCKNIMQCGVSSDEIDEAIEAVIKGANDYDDQEIDDRFYWGDGFTSKKVVEIIQDKIVGSSNEK